MNEEANGRFGEKLKSKKYGYKSNHNGLGLTVRLMKKCKSPNLTNVRVVGHPRLGRKHEKRVGGRGGWDLGG
jgi:hypothetical protein